MAYDRRPWLVRFTEKLGVPDPETGCMEWQGTRNRFGYGQITVKGRRWAAHRLALVIHRGEAIPEGMHVCHRCDNPPCVNPEHLFLGTAKDNARDRQNKGRFTPPVFTRDNHPRTKVSVAAAKEIAATARKGRGGNVAELGRLHGVSRQVIYTIIKEYA